MSVAELGGGAIVPSPVTSTRRARRRHGRGTAGAVLLAVVVLACVVGPLLSPYSAQEFVAAPLLGPSPSHPFGTDALGRDVLVRTLLGGRVDLVVALLGVLVPLLTGTLIGVLSGLAAGSWVDTALMRLVDAVLAFPFNILILALVVALGPNASLGPLPAGVPALLAGLFLTSWSVYARIARGQTLALRDREFLVAARLLGYRRTRIVCRHVLPNVLATTGTYAISDVVIVVSVTASLPFLGAGVQPPAPEWGSLMFDGRDVLSQAPWVCLGPGLMLMLTGIAVRLIGQSAIARLEDRT